MKTRHRFHALCPYFAMFPEVFVQKHLAWSKPDDLVFDPFSGRGTTIFESLLNGRRAIACDVNEVAACVSRAKAAAPEMSVLMTRVAEIEASFDPNAQVVDQGDFFKHCFEPLTFKELMHLRATLAWKETDADCFIAAVALGLLHGESHRSPRYLSNRMPRTISTKPEYSIRWWVKNGCIAPRRHVFELLRTEIRYRFETPPPALRGEVALIDARNAGAVFGKYQGDVSLIITSPPYLDVTNFAEDQWLRLWFLGGETRPTAGRGGDDRHTNAEGYWTFLTEVWSGARTLLKPGARLIIRMGGRRLSLEQTAEGLHSSLREGLERDVRLIEQRTSDIAGGQLRSFRPNAEGTKVEFDFHFQAA